MNTGVEQGRDGPFLMGGNNGAVKALRDRGHSGNIQVLAQDHLEGAGEVEAGDLPVFTTSLIPASCNPRKSEIR